jgi:hypothetical protein
MSGQAQVTHARLIDTLQCGPPEKKYQARQKAEHILFHIITSFMLGYSSF